MSERDDHRLIPIACTLAPTDVDGRISEWRAFFHDCVEATEHQGSVARFELAPTEVALVAATSLAQREKACCAFFEFSIELTPESRWLCVRVPDQADAVLNGFVEMMSGA